MCEDTYDVGPRKERPEHARLRGTDNFDPKDEEWRCLFYHYTGVVEDYSARHFTIESDALWAFNGVAKVFESRGTGSFTWGLPIQNLDAALLWAPDVVLSPYPFEKRAGLHKLIISSYILRLPFPSWSWVSQRNKVNYHTDCEDKVKALVKWHAPVTYLVDPEDPLLTPWQLALDSDANGKIAGGENGQPQFVTIDERSLGFLRFRTSGTHFNVHLQWEGARNRKFESCGVYNLDGRYISSIEVPISWLGTAKVKRGEFILLSEKVETEVPERDIPADEFEAKSGSLYQEGEDQTLYNIMLIDWEQGPQGSVATRVSITEIKRAKWLQEPLVEKTVLSTLARG